MRRETIFRVATSYQAFGSSLSVSRYLSVCPSSFDIVVVWSTRALTAGANSCRRTDELSNGFGCCYAARLCIAMRFSTFLREVLEGPNLS
jgi:hypothetical protein